MNRDDLTFYATLVAAIFAVASVLLQVLTYRRGRSRGVAVSSDALLTNSKPTVVIRVTSIGQAPVVVERIALSFTMWGDQPRLNVPWVLKTMRVLECISSHEIFVVYPSDEAVVSSSPSLPATLTEYQFVTVVIDLDRFAQAIVSRGGISSRIELALILLLLRINVVTPTRTYVRLAHRDIRFYLWKKHGGSSVRGAAPEGTPFK